MERRKALSLTMAGAGAITLGAATPARANETLRVWATRDKLTLPTTIQAGLPFSVRLNLTDDGGRPIGTGSVSCMIVDVETKVGLPPEVVPVCYSSVILDLSNPDTGEPEGQLHMAAQYTRDLLASTSYRGAVLGGTGHYANVLGEYELSTPTPEKILQVITLIRSA